MADSGTNSPRVSTSKPPQSGPLGGSLKDLNNTVEPKTAGK